MPPLVRGDRDRLRQIVVNLVGNAIKFTERGEVELDVWREGSSERRSRPALRRPRYGDRHPDREAESHFRGIRAGRCLDDAPLRRQRPGTRHRLPPGGTHARAPLGRERGCGRGSTFHFTVKLAVASEEAGGQEPMRPAMIQGTRVLVVDDNAANRQILEEILRSWAMEPVCVSRRRGGSAALREARRRGRPTASSSPTRKCPA